jgi:hypothetical protein
VRRGLPVPLAKLPAALAAAARQKGKALAERTVGAAKAFEFHQWTQAQRRALLRDAPRITK